MIICRILSPPGGWGSARFTLRMQISAAASSMPTFPAREANNSDIHLDVNRGGDPSLLEGIARYSRSVLIVRHTALAVVSRGGIGGGGIHARFSKSAARSCFLGGLRGLRRGSGRVGAERCARQTARGSHKARRRNAVGAQGNRQ